MRGADMTGLAKYEAAERALADADTVDEVLEIRNQAEAWRAYAKQAKNRDLEVKAARIRFRAERRLGEMLLASDLAKGGRPKEKTCSDQEQVLDAPPTLAEAGIDRKLSSRAQRVATMDSAEFERALAQHAEEMRAGQGRVAMDLLKIGAEEKGRERRRDLAQVLSDVTAELPSGRQFPCAYIDCPWERKGGIGNRAYENHYPTMRWSEILTFLRGARDALLPDAWAFFWIPRAHLLALVETEIEVTIAATGEIVLGKVDVPLGWAIGHALGMDSYSTCFVWTKTDEQNPDDGGLGLIAWDQDELLLLFKRGQGLPKPAGSEKFGSNHRERAREHSRKPDFYRHMITTMTGGLPVLEMFARVDAEHPLPPDWRAWGNQARATPPGVVGEATDATPSSSSATNEIPQEASGTAREAPSTVCGTSDESRNVGTESAPPPIAADQLELPAFLRRTPLQQTEMDMTRRDRAPPEIVDNALQTRLPLTDDEIELHAALTLVAAGETVEWSSLRNLVGAGFVYATTKRLVVTEEGRAFLAQLVAPAAGVAA
jgi:hypothetical protein